MLTLIRSITCYFEAAKRPAGASAHCRRRPTRTTWVSVGSDTARLLPEDLRSPRAPGLLPVAVDPPAPRPPTVRPGDPAAYPPSSSQSPAYLKPGSRPCGSFFSSERSDQPTGMASPIQQRTDLPDPEMMGGPVASRSLRRCSPRRRQFPARGRCPSPRITRTPFSSTQRTSAAVQSVPRAQANPSPADAGTPVEQTT